MSGAAPILRVAPPGAHDPRLRALLDACFPGAFPEQDFYKQQPHLRILAEAGGALVGQVGLDFRAVRAGARIVPILGIVDLCVAETARGAGLGAALLREAERQAGGRPFGLLFADDPRLYERHGWARLPAAFARFLAIDRLRCHSVMERDVSQELMVKPFGPDPWPAGEIDFLGPIF